LSRPFPCCFSSRRQVPFPPFQLHLHRPSERTEMGGAGGGELAVVPANCFPSLPDRGNWDVGDSKSAPICNPRRRLHQPVWCFSEAISSYWSPSCTRRLRTTWNGRSSRPRYVCSILSSGCVESNLGMQNACVELCLSRTACSIDSVNLCVLLCSN